MKLRTKLLLGYAGFVLALGLLGAWSARTLSQMSEVAGRIIAENYDSVVAAQDMKESLERQDSAALFDLLGQHDRALMEARVGRRHREGLGGQNVVRGLLGVGSEGLGGGGRLGL